MPLYRYKAVSTADEVVEGEMEARSQGAVIERLQELGHLPIRADEIAPGTRGGLLQRDLFAERKVSRRAVALITGELATMLGAGLPIDRAIEILVGLAEKESVARLLARVLDGVRGGASLADAMAEQDGAFPDFYVSMVRAGEAGGTLDIVLARLATHLEKAQALTDSVRSALIYPAILLVMAGLSVVVLLTLVVPEFKPLFDDAGEALPLATRALMVVGELFERWFWLAALIVLIGVLVVRRRLASPGFRLRWDGLMLALPLFGELARKIEVARFARTLGTLLGNGVALLAALTIVKDTLGNAVIGAAVETLGDRLKEGKGLAEPMAASDAFPDLAVQLVRVGEETGALEAMLDKIADIYDAEVGRTTQRLLSLLVPVLTIGLGLLIAAIIGSVLVAFLSVNELAL